MYCTAKDDAHNEPADENMVHKLGNIHKDSRTFEVDHNENEQCVISVVVRIPHTVSVSVSDDDHTSACADELTTNNLEASSKVCSPGNDIPGVIDTCCMNSCIELSETPTETDISENTGIDQICYSQYTCNNFTMCGSYCGTDSNLVSQSQRLQLTNTQKVEIFAMELEKMKVPISAHSSQDSLFDSLTDMSAVFT